jgi:lysophospholipase L1-like esterase
MLLFLSISGNTQLFGAKTKIMLLGDSITGSTCYPFFLWQDLQQNNDTNIVYVGTLTTNYGKGLVCADSIYLQPNEGHAGYRSVDIVTELAGWLQQTHPDVVVLHAGTNNFWNGATSLDIQLTMLSFDQIIDTLRADNPNVKIIVAQIIPMANSAASYAATMMLDDTIPTWASLRSTSQSPITVVDLRTGFDTSAYLVTDRVHPNEVGAKWIGDHVFPALTNVLNPLPIQLSSFSASSVTGSSVQLEWTTISEVNNYGFYVERRLENSPTFEPIGNFIPGAGTSLEQHQYSFTDSSLAVGTYYYRLKQIDLDGKYTYSDEIVVRVTGVTGVFAPEMPHQFELQQNYPNPFNPTTEIKFSVQSREHAVLVVYDMLGREVAKLFDGMAEPGRYYNVSLNGSRLGSGLYTYRIVTDSHSAARKMLLIK